MKTSIEAVNRLHNLLARVFPELSNITVNVAASWVLKLLEKYPTSAKIARAAAASLEKISYLGSAKAQKVQEAASRSVASLHGAVAEQLVRQAVREVVHAAKDEQRMSELAENARLGQLNAAEEMELEEFRRCGRLIEILKLKARKVLPKQ